MKRIFQLIVLGSLTLQVLWFVLPYTWTYFYTGEELDLLSWAGLGASFDINGPIPYAFLFAYGIASIGLISLKKWARLLFLFLTIGTVISSPVWGFIVSPPIDASIGYLLALADGSILTIAYLSVLGSEFK